jgi:hypothetical protein
VAVDASGSRWIDRAEAALRELRDVDGVSVQMQGEKISEIHVETRTRRPAKQIVRDVQTILRTRFGHQIDHRVVSVAYTQSAEDRAAAHSRALSEPAPPAPPAPPAAPAAPAPPETEPRAPAAPVRAAQPRPEPPARDPAPAASAAADERLRFESVNVYVSGPRVQVQVELRWKGLTRAGTATGLTSREAADDLVAAATVAAIQEYLEDDIGLGRAEVAHLRLGRHDVKIVAVPLVAHRMEKMLVGSCTVEQDGQQAVVLGTLAALNRVLGGLRTREPIEYVLRPASPQEASGAKRE